MLEPLPSVHARSRLGVESAMITSSHILHAQPEQAGLMGIITLEDVLESLLQEQIYDENDVSSRLTTRIALHFLKSRHSHVEFAIWIFHRNTS